jgi:hypothetical protein
VKRLALAGLLVLATACSDETVRAPQSAQPVDWSGLETGWTEFSPPPHAAACATSVWTGHELLYWGGDASCQEGPVQDEGAAFNPATRTWRTLAAAPIDGRSSAAAVWSGEELLVWGGWNGNVRGDGAAYRPATDAWRLLADSPLSPQIPTAAVWTGRAMLVWGGPDGAAYDPVEDAWQQLPPAPYALDRAHAVWTGREMIVYGMRLNEPSPEPARGLAYDPASDSWREIAPFELSPQASMVVWTGREMVAWDYEFHAGAYDPASNTWRRLPDLPLEFYECYADGALAGEGFVLAWHCGQAAVLELATDTWRELQRPPSTVRGQAVAAGSVVLFAGAWGENTFWAYRPGPLGATAFVPETDRHGGRDFLPLTFPDGTRIVLSYPIELGLGDLGVQPDVSYQYGDPPDLFALTFEFGPATPRADELALEAGSWTVLSPLGNPGQREVVERSLRVREDPDGFPVVEAIPPLGLSRVGGEGGGPMLALGDLRPEPNIVSSLDPMIELRPTGCRPEHVEIGSSYGARCFGDLYVGVYGDRPFVEAVLDGLRVEES